MAIHQPPSGEAQKATKKRTRLIIDISPELRLRIKIAAAQKDLSMKAYVEEILEQTVPTETTSQPPAQPLNRQAVEALFHMQEAIKRAHPGVIFEDSAEEIRRMREERSEYLDHV